MISLEQYELDFNMYLAEQELFESLFDLGFNCINESAGLITIHEGVKSTIVKYMGKIAQALQGAWEKFTGIINKQEGFIGKIKDKLPSANPNFVIENCPEYDIDLIDKLIIPPYNQEQMKDLKSKADYAEKYFSNIIKDKTKSLKENVKESFVKGRSDQKCTKELMDKMFKFVSDTVPQKVKKIEDNIKVVNNSNKMIENLLNTITQAETTNECVYVYESFILEADDEEKVKFNDGGEDGKGTSAKGDKALTDSVTGYLGISADAISSAMSCVREVYAFFLQTLKHYFKVDKPEDKKPEENTDNVKTQVDLK